MRVTSYDIPFLIYIMNDFHIKFLIIIRYHNISHLWCFKLLTKCINIPGLSCLRNILKTIVSHEVLRPSLSRIVLMRFNHCTKISLGILSYLRQTWVTSMFSRCQEPIFLRYLLAADLQQHCPCQGKKTSNVELPQVPISHKTNMQNNHASLKSLFRNHVPILFFFFFFSFWGAKPD